MSDLLHWSAFFTASIILLAIPGPSVMYVITRGIEHGYRGVFLSSIGLAMGDLLQVCFTALGVSLVLASSRVAFSVVRYAGAAYLIVLGLSRLAHLSDVSLEGEGAKRSQLHKSLILQGFFALNPKTGVFFLALFPQFVANNAGPPGLQIFLFGCVFVLLGLVTNSAYGVLGGLVSSFAKQNYRFQVSTRCITALVLIGMGIAAALPSAALSCSSCASFAGKVRTSAVSHEEAADQTRRAQESV
jgi:threonine/homoserine/homoserine lactone efflux protein